MPHAAAPKDILLVDPRPVFELSPYLFMQFMEPLGIHDASVEAGWDFIHCRWKDHFVEATRQLAPTLIRWGGIFTDYYRWKEGVGPRKRRRPMLNLCWGGTYSSQVGTHEFVRFCRAVGAEPLIGVNFESDGRKHYRRDWLGGLRTAGPKEAAEWVDYCNNPRNPQRRAHGAKGPLDVRLWQIGNETSYSRAGYDCETAARRTLAFARAMRRADPAIELVGWGDSGWMKRMLEVAGEHLKYVAFHPHFDSGLPDSPLKGTEYRRDPQRTWQHLMNAWRLTDDKLREKRQELADAGATGKVGLAITESHFYLYPHNQVDVLRSWAAGVANARVLNVHARNGDILKIATLADFAGNRWTVNAVMIAGPNSYLMPVAKVMQLYRRHTGRKAVALLAVPDGLDVTASRTGGKLFLHVVNVNPTRCVRARLAVQGMKIARGRAFQIAEDPWREIDETCPDLFAPVELPVPPGRERLQGPRRAGASGLGELQWSFPPASVTAMELPVQPR